MSKNVALQLTDGLYDVGFNWREEGALASGETVIASVWEKLFGSITANESGSQVDDLPGASFDDDQTAIWFKGGVQGTTSKLKNTVTTSGGRELNDVIIVTILDLLDPNIVVPDSRRFRLIPTDAAGLVGEIAKSFQVGVQTTIAVDFINDLPIYGRLVSVDSVSIKTGQGGGLEFDSAAPHATLAKVRLTPVYAGQYVVTVKAGYENPTSDQDAGQGEIVINAVA